MFDEYKVFGPYKRSDGRKHIVLEHKVTKKKVTLSYPKYLYQLHHNVALTKEDTIDHKDRNFENDSIDNLVLRERKEHSSLDAKRVKKVECICAWCKASFERSPSAIDWNSKSLKAGPFCGKSCAGKYGASVQNGSERFEVQSGISKSEREYFFSEKPL